MSSSLLAWYFVITWGSGYLATKVGLQYAPPFTFLSLRFAFGLLLVIPVALAGAGVKTKLYFIRRMGGKMQTVNPDGR